MSKVFESPDGGETVYVREVGSSKRTLHSESPKKRSMYDKIMEDKLWGDIRREAETNSTLQAAMERVKVTYYLTDDYERRYGNRKTRHQT
jgi:hypothetical protein